MKKTKRFEQAHTPRSPKGVGDYYGTGVKNPIGKVRDAMGEIKLGKKLKKPPKSLA